MVNEIGRALDALLYEPEEGTRSWPGRIRLRPRRCCNADRWNRGLSCGAAPRFLGDVRKPPSYRNRCPNGLLSAG